MTAARPSEKCSTCLPNECRSWPTIALTGAYGELCLRPVDGRWLLALTRNGALYVIDLASRRVQIVGSTRHPDERFMQHVVRTLTVADEGLLVQHRVLIGDRDTKWSAPVPPD